MCIPCGWFMLMTRRDKHNIVEQSSFNKKNFLNKNKNKTSFLLNHFGFSCCGFFFFFFPQKLKLHSICFPEPQPWAYSRFVQSTSRAPQNPPPAMPSIHVITGRRENWLIPNLVLYEGFVPPGRSACVHTDRELEYWLGPKEENVLIVIKRKTYSSKQYSFLRFFSSTIYTYVRMCVNQ